MKKTFISLLILFSLVARPTYALGPVVETGLNLINNTISSIEQVWSTTAMTVLEPLVKITAERLLSKVSDDVLSWANNGFDGEPGFINNWDGFLEETKYETISQGFQQAQRARSQVQSSVLSGTAGNACSDLVNPGPCDGQYLNNFDGCIDGLDPVEDEDSYQLCEETFQVEEMIYEQCTEDVFEYEDQLEACTSGENPNISPEEAAQQNYELSQSDSYQNSRSIERTVINYGSRQFGDDALTQAIEQQGENLTELIGEQAKKRFEDDFSAGGWEGYLALINPSNTKVGTESLVRSAIQSQTMSEVDNVVTDLQTPQRFLDKTRCIERDENDNCIREEVLTPGAQVAAKVNEALFKDENLANNADGLIIPLIKSAVGKVTSSLISQGLSQIGGVAASSSFYSAADNTFLNANQGSSNIQSQYDVLGVSDDGFIDSSSPTELSQFQNSVGSLEGMPVGGPEDVANFGQGGAQIIINFEENLERMINFADEEQSYFNELDQLRSQSMGTVITLDRCLPGPDYKWEDRFSDLFPSGSDEVGQLNSLGLSQTRQMFADERVNIPGAAEMKSAINSVISGNRQQEAQSQQRKDVLGSLRSNLSFIKDQILIDFNIQKMAINENLVLFYEDWEELTQSQQIELGEIAIAPENGFLISSGNDDVESLVIQDNQKVAKAVIAMGWDLWRTETDREQKTDLRYSYHIEQNNLSNQDFVSRARAQVNQTREKVLQSEQLSRDCLIFKAYTLGTSLEDIESVILSGDSALLGDVSNQVTDLLSFSGLSIAGTFLSNVFSNPEFVFINTSNARTNDEIRTFLEQEYENYLNSQNNLFLTGIIVGNINNSVLGFTSIEEQDDYYNNLYPMDEFPYTNIVNNRYQVSDMFKYDNFFYQGNRINHISGALFCRHKDTYKIHNEPVLGGDDVYNSVCLRDWYRASDLDYEVAFAGI